MISCRTGEKLSKWSSEVEDSQLFDLFSHTYQEIRSLKFTLLAARAASQFDYDKDQADVTKITHKLWKLKSNPNVFILKVWFVLQFSETLRILQ